MFCGVLTWRLGYDAPYWDQWWKIPLIVKAFEGTIGFGDYWTLINEHRVFFPNLLTIPLAKLTHWTIGYELALTLVFTAGAFYVLCRGLLDTGEHEERMRVWEILPIISLLLFSYSQHNIWMWGLHVMIPMTLLAMLVSIRSLIVPEPSTMNVVVAIVFAVIASYSFGAGIVIWGVGGAILIAGTLEKTKAAYVRLGVWGGACVLTMAIYFVGYESTPTETTAVQVFGHPIQFMMYIVAYLGAPVAPFHGTSALLAGLFGIGWCAYLFKNLQWRTLNHSTRFALSLMLLALGCALLTGLKQWPEGTAQAISSRYLMWPTMFWTGLLALAVQGSGSRQMMKSFTAVVVFCGVFGTVYGAYRADERHSAFELGKEALRTNTHEEHLLYMYPTVDVPNEMRDELIRYKLSIFRDRSGDVSERE